MLLSPAAHTTEIKDDLLADATKLYKVDVKAIRKETEKAERDKMPKLGTAKAKKAKTPGKAPQTTK
jgi:hypothetical protein